MRRRSLQSTIEASYSLRSVETVKHSPNRNGRSIAVGVTLLVGLLLSFVLPAVAADQSEASNIFKKRCSACHTFGKGPKVGPDLKGVTDRRKPDWLQKFIHSSQSVIQSGDPTAVALFHQFKEQRMPDWLDLSPETITALLKYFADNGPEQKEPDEYPAQQATPQQIESGRKLFYGESRLKYGGQSCSSCHRIGGGMAGGGTLGPDLTRAYDRYRDTALTLFFKRPCFLRAPEISNAKYLDPQESFDLKAFLAQASGIKFSPPAAAPSPAPSGDSKRGTR
ncbi:MAG TPA: c-type cytochrome [Candidatus Angelobacter sp.]|nr:c-type cytochrome [Candidatus Angelobacter sp.]